MRFKKDKKGVFRRFLSLPFIYWMIVPAVFMDISLEIYHRIAFRLYKIPIVDRTKYIAVDRHRLQYLNFLQKINCAYCGYVNGLLAYAVKIAAETEKYFCGIKHRNEIMEYFEQPEHHEEFIDYNDEDAFKDLG